MSSAFKAANHKARLVHGTDKYKGMYTTLNGWIRWKINTTEEHPIHSKPKGSIRSTVSLTYYLESLWTSINIFPYWVFVPLVVWTNQGQKNPNIFSIRVHYNAVKSSLVMEVTQKTEELRTVNCTTIPCRLIKNRLIYVHIL